MIKYLFQGKSSDDFDKEEICIKEITAHSCWRHSVDFLSDEKITQWKELVKIQNCSRCLDNELCGYGAGCLKHLETCLETLAHGLGEVI